MPLDKHILDQLPTAKRIDDYLVVIDTDDGESTYCHIIDDLRTGASASLGVLLDYGGLDDGYERNPVDPATIKRIEDWVMSTGLY